MHGSLSKVQLRRKPYTCKDLGAKSSRSAGNGTSIAASKTSRRAESLTAWPHVAKPSKSASHILVGALRNMYAGSVGS